MAKGLAIILVIVGHSSFVPPLAKMILYIFHIPLFFFLSGFTLNVRKYETFSGYFLNKWKSLVVPFFLLNIFVFLFQLFVMYPVAYLFSIVVFECFVFGSCFQLLYFKEKMEFGTVGDNNPISLGFSLSGTKGI